ncbi:MAG: TonB-dependent receptor [Acidobacteriaceae bacterium]|nr:TonB-dependent receptor [Acidobacteriaceae bacterium]
MKKRFLGFALSLAVAAPTALVLTAPMAMAQTNSGDIVGTVKDASGALIPNASVTVVSETTNIHFAAKTNSAGEYRIPNLLPASYDVRIEAPGFLAYVQRGVLVQVGKSSSAFAVLTVGANSTVEVDVDAPSVLDTTSQNLTTTFGQQELGILPTATSGYGALNASLLAPNVASPGGIGIGTGPSVGGQRPRNNNYTIEGIDDNSKSVTGPILLVPNDATGDFTLVANQFSPEFGHSSGGQFNTNILSGSNHFHGRLYEYFDNRDLNALSGVAGGKSDNSRYDYNRYGGQLGGPIFRNKLFFFTNFERSTLGQAQNYFLCTPTAAGRTTLQGLNYGMRAENLNTYLGLTPAANVNGGAQIDASEDLACFDQDSGGQSITVTDSNGIGKAVQIPMGMAHMTPSNFANTDQTTTSVDYTPNSTDSFRFRYMYFTEGAVDTTASIPVFQGDIPLREHLASFGWFHNFTPNLINEVRIGFNREYQDFPVSGPGFPGLDSFPNLIFYDADIDIGPDDNAPQSNIQNFYQLVDNLSYTKGHHTLKFGFDGRKYIAPQNFVQRQRGDYEWYQADDYLHDNAPTYFGERSAGASNYAGDQTAFYGYFNDTWRATSKLTLNYGLRYEFTSVPSGQRQQSENALASVAGVISFGAPQPQYTNFAPRIGLAYAPDDKTSIRAGFGMAYDVLFDNLGLLSLPPQFSQTHDVGSGAICSNNTVCPDYGSPNFLANGGLPSALTPLTDATTAREETAAYIPNQTLPYSENWNLTIERVFLKNYTATIQYLGTRGVHLPLQDQLNVQARANAGNALTTYTGLALQTDDDSGEQYAIAASSRNLAAIYANSNIISAYANNNFNSKITSYQPYGGSNYNGLGLNLTRRFINGLQLNFSYTYSRAMDDSTAEVAASDLTQRRPQDSQNIHAEYSRSALDRPQRLTLEAVWLEPFFKHSNWALRNTLGNWEISPIYTYESPEYVTPTSNINSNGNGDAGSISRTYYNANGVKGTGSKVVPVFSSTPSSSCVASMNAFATTAAVRASCYGSVVGWQAVNPNAQYIVSGLGTLPTAQRNTMPGRPINNWTMSAGKRISFTDRYSFEFQAQAFNLFNHAQYVPGDVDGIGATSTYGAASSTYLNPGNTAFNNPEKVWTNHARNLQLTAKFNF